jgi:hypothetical protein
MALNDWDEEDQHGGSAQEDERSGNLGGSGFLLFAGLAGLYIVIVAFLLNALPI